MAIKLNREGIALNAEERNKRNQNWTALEDAIESVGEGSAETLAKVTAAETKAMEAKNIATAADDKSTNVQNQLSTLVVQGDSSPQATQASVGADGTSYDGNLKARLDAEHNTVTAQLAEKVAKTELDALGKLTFSGTYATLAELQTAYPTGSQGLFLITGDGFTYRWNGTSWVKAAQFQSAGIADKGIESTKFGDSVHILNKLLFANGVNKKIASSATSMATAVDNKLVFTGAGYVQYNFDYLGFAIGNKVNFIFKANYDKADLANFIRVRTSVITDFTPAVYLGNGLYAILDYQITELPRNLFIDNRTLNIPNLQLELFVGYNEYPLMNAEYGKVIGKVNDISVQSQIRYVTLNGSDNTKFGTSESDGFATLQKALDSGANTIYVQRGIYYNQSAIKAKENVLILPITNGTQKVEFRGSDKLNNANWVAQGTVFKQPYTGNTHFTSVFVSKTKPPIAAGTRPSYNAGMWEGNDRNSDILMKPVLTLAECEAERGTFFYDETNVFINPTGGVIGEKEYNAVKLNSGMDLRGSGNVTMRDILFDFYMNEPMNLDNIKNIDIRSCETGHSVLADGMSIDDTSGKIVDCKSFKNRRDGYNLHNTGDTEFINCEGFNNYDDGISHHDKCTGVITGGKWYGNGKAGIAPAYGAKVNWYNCVIERNLYGVYQDSYAGVSNVSSGNLYLGNGTAILNNAELKSIGDKFVGNTKDFMWANSVEIY